jgi:hypothetical protein
MTFVTCWHKCNYEREKKRKRERETERQRERERERERQMTEGGREEVLETKASSFSNSQ